MKLKEVQVSAVIIAKNQQDNIKECIRTLDWVDEIVVVDTGSKDDTAKVAERLGAKVFLTKTTSFSDWRNFGTRKANGKLILHIDTDERSTAEVAKEVMGLIDDTAGAYAIPRRNFILGKEMKHGGQWPDYVVHLLRKSNFEKWVGDLHEVPRYTGNLKHLKNPILHYKHDNLADMVEKTNGWSEIEAKLMFDSGHPTMTVLRFFSAMFREFWLRMIRQAAFLDGPKGMIYAFYQVFSRFVSYAKLWEMQINNSKFKIQKSK